MPDPNPAPAPALDAAALAQIRRDLNSSTAEGTFGPLSREWVSEKMRALIAEVERLATKGERADSLLAELHGHVAELCKLAGAPESAAHDSWTLAESVQRLKAEVARLADAEMVAWLMMQQLIYQGRATPRVYRLSGSAAWHLEWYDHSRVTRRDSTAGAFEMPTLENLPPEDRAQIADAFAKWKEARDAR